MKYYLKTVLILGCLMPGHFESHAQEIQKVTTQKDLSLKAPFFSVDFIFIPAIVYNKIEIGLNFQQNMRIEHCIRSSASLILFGFFSERFSLGYSLNVYHHNQKIYIPFSAYLLNALNDVNYEEGYFPNKLRPTLATGIGYRANLSKKFYLRVEGLAGAALNLTNGSSCIRPFSDLDTYHFDKYYPNQNRKLVPALRLNFTVVRAF